MRTVDDLHRLFAAARPDLPPAGITVDDITAKARGIRRRQKIVTAVSATAFAVIAGAGAVVLPHQLGRPAIPVAAAPSSTPARIPMQFTVPNGYRAVSIERPSNGPDVITVKLVSATGDTIEITESAGTSADECRPVATAFRCTVKAGRYPFHVVVTDTRADTGGLRASGVAKNMTFADPTDPATWFPF
jgi:hypothetical protein